MSRWPHVTLRTTFCCALLLSLTTLRAEPPTGDEFGYERQPKPVARVVSTTKDAGSTRERLVITVPGGNDIPASLHLPAEGAGPFPAVVLIHGAYADRKERMIKRFATRLNRAGVACIAFDLPGHGERMAQDRARFRQSLGLLLLQVVVARGQNVPPELQATAAVLAGGPVARYERLAPIIGSGIAESVVDARRVIDYLDARPEIDGDRIGVCGMSLGGTVSVLLTSADPRVRAACLYVTGAWSQFADATSDERTRLAWARVDPAAHAARLTRPTLMLNGRRDPLVLTTDADALFAHLAGPKDQQWFDGGHQPVPGALDDGSQWLARQLRVTPTTQNGPSK